MDYLSREDAAKRDSADPLKPKRAEFDLPDGAIYLDGNSLGPPPRRAPARPEQTARNEWRNGLIRSWNDAGWIDLPKRCGGKIAKLIGVDPTDVIVADSVSVNLFKLAAALLAKHPGALAVEAGEFPTDGYILEGLSRLTGAPLHVLPPDEPGALSRHNIRVLIKSAVHYKTAAIADMAAWEAEAAKAGVSIIWDLSHAAGVIALDLDATGAKYAAGCGYKFLNGGPGAPAYIYVNGSVSKELHQPLSGWMGHAAPFEFSASYRPAPGVSRFACGTPPILSLSALDAALDVFDGADMASLEDKAQFLGDVFLARALSHGLETVSPGIGERRGGHVSFNHENAYEIVQALIGRGAIGDFRAPNLMRFGFSPLFLSYEEVWRAGAILKDVIDSGAYRDPAYARRNAVT